MMKVTKKILNENKNIINKRVSIIKRSIKKYRKIKIRIPETKMKGKSSGKTQNTEHKKAGIKNKPQFKRNDFLKNKGNKKGNQNKSITSQLLTQAEARRLERIREQSESKAVKEAHQLQRKKEKKRKLKILAKKNSKGQPVMKGRMELLLEKIEKRLS